ncbi:MAG: nuclear transport factor 2 family protein [Planctomycetes bacterium]|nr:nuclear transport factor 2 family protein [Planctomycetota bacterium]
MNRLPLRLALVGCLTGFTIAQELPPLQQQPGSGNPPVPYFVQLPVGHQEGQCVPLAVVIGAVEGEEAARALATVQASELARRGFVAVVPVVASPPATSLGAPVRPWAPLCAELRQRYRIEQGGMHAVVDGDELAANLALDHRTEFQTFVVHGRASAEAAKLLRLPSRRVRTLTGTDAVAVATAVAELHAERQAPGAIGEVARVLDDFHDAAANGDEDRYFAILPDDALFLGTDATERWTGLQFRKEHRRYFQRPSAWTYVALQRHVVIEADGNLALFDEIFDNDSYGECRGSGVMWKRDGRWVLRQYHLTIPVPNDLAPGIARHIRAFQAGGPAPAAATIVFVRHAEKVDQSNDPELSAEGAARAEALARVLRDLPITTVYHTEFRRTAATVAPLCAARGITPDMVPAADVNELVRKLKRAAPGSVVVVCGHSNTVPELIEQLGVKGAPAFGDTEFDRLLVVRRDADGAVLLPLRYGR